MRTELLESLDEIFTTPQAAKNGLDARRLASLVDDGLISRVGHGVYRVGAATVGLNPLGVCLAKRVAVSHESAVTWVGGSVPYAPPDLQATAPRSRGHRLDEIEGLRLHRADLSADDSIVVRGLTVTSPLRTILDVARSAPLHEAVAMSDSLCRLGLVTASEAASAAIALPPAPGRQAAIQVTQLIDAKADSVFESMSRVSLTVAGLAPTASQFNVFADDGKWIGRVDFAWPKHRLILECDGYEFHRDRDRFDHDRYRWAELTRAGWTVLVVTWRRAIGQPGYLVDLVGDMLAAA